MQQLAVPPANATVAPGPWLFVAEIEHRMANVYASAAASISLAARRASNEGARAAFRAASERLLAHADLHRAVQAPLAAGPVDLFAYLGTLCEAASRADLGGRGAHFLLRGEAIEVGAERAWISGLIVLELIINAAKHGSAGRGGPIGVDLHLDRGLVRCRVIDGGATAAPTNAGNGSRIISELSATLGGNVVTTFGCVGTVATLTFPEVPDA